MLIFNNVVSTATGAAYWLCTCCNSSYTGTTSCNSKLDNPKKMDACSDAEDKACWASAFNAPELCIKISLIDVCISMISFLNCNLFSLYFSI
ncbi:hypothetical protein D1872_256370 [compost metagenome]